MSSKIFKIDDCIPEIEIEREPVKVKDLNVAPDISEGEKTKLCNLHNKFRHGIAMITIRMNFSLPDVDDGIE